MAGPGAFCVHDRCESELWGICRFNELYEKGGELALQEILRKKPILVNRIGAQIEAQVVAFSLKQPAFGPIRVANEMKKLGHLLSPAGVHPTRLRLAEPLASFAQNTFYVGNMKGVGRIHQQTFIDTYSKATFAKLYDRKSAITTADLLNDRVVPFFDEKEVKFSHVLTDRGTEYCGNPEHHEYGLYLALEDIDHSRPKTKSQQMNGICERFHKTVLDEF